MKSIDQLKKDFQSLADSKQAVNLQRFFKTGKGEYGEGDIFLGIKVPIQRKLVRKYYKELDLKEIEELLHSKIHEHRLISLLILDLQFKSKSPLPPFKKGEYLREEIFDLYLRNTKYINNWDLVDLSAPNIVGQYLLDKDRKILYKLARSKNLWEKRIAVLSTFAFIRNGQFDDSLQISEILLNDGHDLIHKAVGWMLREIGKRNIKIEEDFLKKNYKKMPRTMLRYAIEKFPEEKRKFYLNKKLINSPFVKGE